MVARGRPTPAAPVVIAALLIASGVGLVVALVFVLRSRTLQRSIFRGNAGFRSRAHLKPVESEVFARQLEAGIYAGLCFGIVVAILGVLVAIG